MSRVPKILAGLKAEAQLSNVAEGGTRRGLGVRRVWRGWPRNLGYPDARL